MQFIYIRFHFTMEDKRLQTALNWLSRCKTVSQFKALSKEESSAVIVKLISERSRSRRNVNGQKFTLKEMKRRVGKLEVYFERFLKTEEVWKAMRAHCKENNIGKRQFGDEIENSGQNLQPDIALELESTVVKTLPLVQSKLIAFSPVKLSQVQKYSFRDCLDVDDLDALKARFEKALEMPEFCMFMEKMEPGDFASAMLHTRSKFIIVDNEHFI